MAISDNRIVVKVEARKLTTRDGSHEDDQLYLSQIKSQVRDFLNMLDFKKTDVSVTFGLGDPEIEPNKCSICFKELRLDIASQRYYCPLHGSSGVPNKRSA